MHLNNWTVYLLILILLIYGCKASQSLVGKYCMISDKSPDNTTIVFKNDKTFTGISHSDIGGEFLVQGTWEMNDGVVITKSRKLKVIDSLIMRNDPSVINSLKLKILDAEKLKPLEGVVITVNDKEGKQYTTDSKGYATIKNNATEITLNYIGIKDSLGLERGANNEIDIYLNFKNIRTFDIPEKWEMKGHSIY